ncbi:MAG: hypothetical protein ABSD53_08720 [Terriglobales bacterium]
MASHTQLPTTNLPQIAASKPDPTQEFGERIAEIVYEAPAFADAGQFKTAFDKAEQGAHDAAKKKFSAEAEMILYIAEVQSYLSERGANAHLRKAAGIKAGFAEWYESFRAEYDIDYAFKSMQHKIAQLRGGCVHCGRLADIHNKSCVFYRKLIDQAKPEDKSGKPGPALNMEEANNAYLADRYLFMIGLLANAPKDASPQEIIATMQEEAVVAHQDLDGETAKRIKVPKLMLPEVAEQLADDPKMAELENEIVRLNGENASLLQRLGTLQTVPDNLRDETITESLAAEPDRGEAESILHDYLATVVNRVLPPHIKLDTLSVCVRYAGRDHRIMIGDWLVKQKPHTKDVPVLAKCTAIGECGARRRVREWVDGAWAKEHVVYSGDEGNYRVITEDAARQLASDAFSAKQSKEGL